MSTNSTGNEWQDWAKPAPAANEGPKWKPSANVGALVRLTIGGYKEVETALYDLWTFVECDVDVIEPDGSAYTTYPAQPLSGVWYVSTFRNAPIGYQALGVVTAETFSNGRTGYAMRALTDAEEAIVRKAIPGL